MTPDASPSPSSIPSSADFILAPATDGRVHASYWLETGDDPARAAEAIAGEQSSGTFVALPGETPELKARAGARVERLQVLDDDVRQPTLPGGMPAKRWRRCRMALSWPMDNLGPSLPNLLATVSGNLFELRQVSGLRLTGLALPPAFVRAGPGPAFGIEGTRRLVSSSVPVPAGEDARPGPLLGTIIKPSVGLSPEETAQQVRVLVDAGIDFIKDDELQADGPHCPFDERVRAVMRVVRDAAQRHGRQVMVAFNLTGEVDQMRRRHDLVLREGGTCVMLTLPAVGLAGVQALRQHAQLPLHGHRAGWGALSRHPGLGWDFAPWQMLWRLAGVDHLHVNGLRNKFSEPDASVVAAAQAVLAPLWPQAPLAALPVFSSGQTGRQAADTLAALGGRADLIHTVGGGIFGHPDGVRAGVQALREAWMAALAGEPLERLARHRPTLRRALEFWR